MPLKGMTYFVSKASALINYRIESPLKRRVGRPRKDKSSTSPARLRSRPSKKSVDEEDDASYQPTESDNVEEGDENAEEDMEMAALAWGLITAGGLGTGSAGIYGAEILAR